MRLTASRYRVSFWSDQSALELDSGMVVQRVNLLKLTEVYSIKW